MRRDQRNNLNIDNPGESRGCVLYYQGGRHPAGKRAGVTPATSTQSTPSRTTTFSAWSHSGRPPDVTGSMRFWEFDVFGGIAEGKLIIDGNKIHHEYEYEVEGKKELFRDSWEYVDKNTYLLSVKMKIEEGWKVFTSNELIREE